MKKNTLFVLGLIIVLTYYIPFLIMGQDMFVYDHDFLDSHHAYLKVLADRGELFSFGTFPAMEGVSTCGFDSFYPLRLLIYYVFKPFTAMIIGDLVARIVAYSGMFLLLCKLSQNDNRRVILAFLMSILFGYLYFHDGYFELGSAGMPLLAYCYMNLFDGQRKVLSYIYIVFFASFSSIFHAAFFCCIILSLFLVYDYYKHRIIRINFTLGILVLGISSLLFSYSTIISFLYGEASHRVEFILGLNLKDAIQEACNMLFLTQEHTGILPTKIILLVTIVTILIRKTILERRIYIVSIFILSILLFFVVYQYAKYLLPNFHLIQMFQADRFYFMLPTAFIVLFYFVGCELLEYKHGLGIMLLACLLQFCQVVLHNPEFHQLTESLIKGKNKYPTYRQFYDQELFNNIKNEITELNTTKCCAVGFYPSILSYNGLYTVDGYFVSYPLKYKHKFRNIIAGELEKNKILKKYYDNWGSRCYVFSSELDEKGNRYLSSKYDNSAIEYLDLNTEALKSLGCEYIISSVDIKNYGELKLSFIKKYTTNQSFWAIRVYRLE